MQKNSMKETSWVRVYHAYFQSMVVEGLTSLAYNAMGEDAGFAAVAGIIERGAMKGFGVLLEEVSKAGLRLGSIGIEELLQYEVSCHRKAVEEMSVGFQVFEKAKRIENGYVLETKKCIYEELVKKNPLVCAICVGLTTGILKRFGLRVQWLRKLQRKNQLCMRDNQPEYVVYRDPQVRLPACRIVVERLECGENK